MVKSAAATPEAYLANLPPERRVVIAAVRQVVLANLPPGYRESMNWGMISYEVPLERFPTTYNKQPLMYAALAAQKNYCSLYLNSVYQAGIDGLNDQSAEAQLQEEFALAGKKLNMGKSCLRFKKAEDLPLEAIGRVIARTSVEEFVAGYQRSRHGRG